MKPFRPFAVLAVALFVSGCAYDVVTREEQLMMNSRYVEIVDRLEPRVVANPDAKTNDVMVLCMAYMNLKDYRRLFACLDQVDEHIRTGRNTVYITDITYFPHQIRAEAYIELGQYPDAIVNAQKLYELSGLGLMERGQRVYALSLRGLAEALGGHPQKARASADELEGIGTHYPFVLLETPKAVGLSRIYMALKDYPKALAAIDIASAESAWQGVADLVTGASMRGESMFAWEQLPKKYTHGRAFLEMGRWDEARADFDALLADGRSAENGQIYWLLLYDRGRIALHDGDTAGAIRLYRQAVDVIERQRSTLSTEASKIGFVGDKQAVYGSLIGLLIDAGHHEEAFAYAERGKARALVDMLAERGQFASRDMDPADVRALLTELEDLERKSMYQPMSVDVADAQSRSRSLSSVRERLLAGAPHLASLVTVSAEGAAAAQAQIAPDETLVEYYHKGGDALFAFAVTRDRVRAWRLDGRGLDEAVQRFRAALSMYQSDAWREHARTLYDRLLAPMDGMLDKPNLIVVPHGGLHYLPFAALVSGSGAVIDRYALRVLPSASVLGFLTGRGAAGHELLVLGNPDLGDPRWNLPGAEAEARAIARAWPDSLVVLRKGATESVIKKAGGQFRFIHLASHGQFSADDPLASKMLLAPDDANDGELTVAEIYDLDLRADLVTLSACETGMGKVANGDDVVGLTRGFLYAGARSVVASLGPVADEPTKLLMTRFYDNLKRMDKRAALRAAQLDARKVYPHPYFWAAFQVTGGI
ncbi:MAG: CHAT domain-containing protein [Alphaproteobacteria bacterium]|nr:CHAT domain-containing protein [Alphaproteobacteria bacterium]